MIVPPSPFDESELLAAELALGLLDPAEREAAEARLARDPAFAAAHRRWQKQAAALVDGPGEPPRPSVWAAIVNRLPTNDPSRPAAKVPSGSGLWRAAAALSALAAAVLAVIVVERPRPAPVVVIPPPTAGPGLVAVLMSKGRAVVTVSFDPGADRLVLAPAALDLPGHAAELWVIPADGRPRSLGVIAATGPSVTRPPVAGRLIVAGATLAISVEPEGGSPTGLPTGPVILTGKAVAI